MVHRNAKNILKDELRGMWVTGAAALQSHLRFGHNIFESDWDALIILDTCRIDALREMRPHFGFINNVESKWSRGSTSKEWLENTFVEAYREEIAQTAYVTANSFARKFQRDKIDRLDYLLSSNSVLTDSAIVERLVNHDQLRAEDFLLYDSLWEKVTDGRPYREIHPQTITDRAINVGRDTDAERLIIHYMQPHAPYIYPDQMTDFHRNPLQYTGEGDKDSKAWNGYLENLRFVLGYVSQLLNNLDAETVVITADHGELFGKYLRTHPIGLPHPRLRKVPWMITTATDSETHSPEKLELTEDLSESNIESRLSDLGYL